MTRAGMNVSVKDSQLQRQQDRPARFPNLRSAGRDLSVALEAYARTEKTVVLGIATGGVPVAHEVAKNLNLPLDFIFKRTLLTPRGPGSQLSAINVAGTLVLPDELPPRPATPSTPLDYFLVDALTELEQRERTCRGGRRPRDLTGETIIVVDCGIRTGLTMLPAIVAVRTLNPVKLIAGVPVGSQEACASVAAVVDEFHCLSQPEPFGHVGMWYTDFSRPNDEHIHKLLDVK